MDPFLITGPAAVSFSGGRTSGMMLRRCLDAHGGALPADVHVLFQNTGREREETLRFVADCAERWGVWVRWLERDSGSPWGFREVEHETASRNGEPFAELISERKFLPNGVARFCTQALKLEVMAAFMRSLGHETWMNVVGFRADEAHRVAKLRARESDWSVTFPLHAARITNRDVMAFWRAQGFDLGLARGQGNCDGCFLKHTAALDRFAREQPERLAWWAEQEKRVGGTFRSGVSYAQTLDRARRLPLLPMDLEYIEALPCGCTDRRAPRRCTCGKRRGQGHALTCGMVLGEERGAA